MKVCIVCGQEKPLDQFPTNRGMKDGHLGWCFECFAQRHKFYHYPTEVAPQPREEHRGRPRTRVGSTPEECAELERKREYAKYFHRRNKQKYLERTRARSRRYYWANREKELERQKEYRKRKKEQCQQNVRTTSMQSVSTLMKSRA